MNTLEKPMTHKPKITLICLDRDNLLFKQMYNQYSKTHDIQVWEISQNVGVVEETHTALIIPSVTNFSNGQTIDYIRKMGETIIKDKKFTRVILLSSSKVYGVSNNQNDLFIESSPCRPYDITSGNFTLIEDELIFQYRRFSDKFPLIVLRICEIISKERVEQMINLIKSHSTKTVDYTQYNFIYIEDVVQAISVVSSSSFVGKKYNVTSSEKYSYEDIYDIVTENQIRRYENNEIIQYNLSDGGFILRELKWKAHTPVKEIIQSIMREFK